MDILKMVENFSSRLARIGVQAERCCRVRSLLARCTRCLEVCPTGGISWPAGELHIGRCLDCGLCTAVCPTGALCLQEPGEEQIIRRVEVLAAEYGAAVILCERQESARNLPQGMVVPCLGALSPDFLLLVLARSLAVQFYLAPEACSACQVAGGGEIFRLRLEEIGVANKLAGLSAVVVNEVRPAAGRERGHGGAGEQVTNRRKLLTQAWQGLRQLPLVMLRDALVEEDGADGKRTKLAELPGQVPPRRRLYLEAVKHGGNMPDLYQQPGVRGTCFFCRACTILCPTGSLRQVEEGDSVSLYLDTATCTGCGLCAQACFHQTLLLEGGCEDPGQDRHLVLVKGWQQRCAECGQEFSASTESSRCPGCAGKEGALFAG
ncbi:MAG: hypothetical protein D9V47_02805 [Clostridia bacterium]|nr:MAG: hypothetical protein D9V47_02805 [Clostridia bacterium]